MNELERPPTESDQSQQHAAVRVLGQILAAQNVVFALPDSARMAEFYAQTLMSIPGIAACRVCLDDRSVRAGDLPDDVCVNCERLRRPAGKEHALEPPAVDFKCSLADEFDLQAVAIESVDHHFGVFVLRVSDALIFEVYRPFIQNLSSFLALTLENRRHRRSLEQARAELERRVEERTRDLTAANVELQREAEWRRQAQAALEASEQKFRSFVQESSEGFMLIDEQGLIIEWNRAREKMTGLAADQVLGRPLWDVQQDMLPLEVRTPERREHNRQLMLEALRTGQSPLFDNAIEAEVLTQTGERRFVRQIIFPIKANRGYRIGSVTSDVTERKRAEQALRASEERYRIVADNTYDWEFWISPQGQFLYNSPSCRRITGHTPDEFAANPELLNRIIHPADLERYRLHHHFVVEQQVPEEIEFRIVRADGDVRYIGHVCQPVFDGQGTYQGNRGSNRDITAHKQAENELRDSERRLAEAQRIAHIGYWERDFEAGCITLSAEACRIFGLSPQEVPLNLDQWHQRWLQLVHPDDRLRASQAAADAVGDGPPYNVEYRIVRPDGEVRFIHSEASVRRDASGRPRYMLGMMQDITERKRAEARVLRLNRLYATLSQINQTIVHVRDRAQLFAQICRVAVEHGQFRMAWIGLIDEATDQIVPVAFAGEESGYLAEARITARDERQGRGPTGTAVREGRCVICHNVATDPLMEPWRDAALQRGYRSLAAVPIRENGRPVGALAVYAAEPHGFDIEDEQLLDEIGQDISYALDALEQEAQRQRAEVELNRLNAELEQRIAERTAELARAHERLRAILDTAGEGVVFTDSQGAIEYINPAMERLTGYSADEVLGHNPRIWKSDQTPPSTHQHMWQALLRGETWQGEVINRRKDGTLYDAALTASPVTDLDGRSVGYVGVQRDITRQKELDRLKDQFVSNVSHELRTPLANVMLHIGLLTRGRPERRDIYLRTLQREAERLRKMIEDLLDLSKLDRGVMPIRLASTDVHQLLESLVLDRAALAAQRGLTLQYQPAPDLPMAVTDGSKLTQVISNLLTNALNYTPSGGEVSVSSALQRTADRRWLTIQVRDTGPGIAAKDLAHLFKRFYRGEAGRTTDAPGAGLGLAISHEIVQRLGGRITVISEPGHGAAFTIWLPIT